MGIATLVALSMLAQAEFEVASVKPSAPDQLDRVQIGIHIDGALVICKSLSLRDYVRIAFQMKDYQISGPDWISSAKFDINAKLPDGASRADVPAMMQALLTERFKMAAHRDKKDFNVYALVVAPGGPKLAESTAGESDEPAKNSTNVAVDAGRGGATINFGGGSSISITGQTVDARKIQMVRLVDTIADFVDRPVIDATGLSGNYDLKLDYSFDELRSMLRARGQYRTIPDIPVENRGTSIFDSVKKYGLRLDSRKAPLDVLVVDRAEKVAAGN